MWIYYRLLSEDFTQYVGMVSEIPIFTPEKNLVYTGQRNHGAERSGAVVTKFSGFDGK